MPEDLVPKELADLMFELGLAAPRSYKPTLNEAADFLREKGLHVMTDKFNHNDWRYQIRKLKTGKLLAEWTGVFDSHPAALLSGIPKALTIFKEGI